MTPFQLAFIVLAFLFVLMVSLPIYAILLLCSKTFRASVGLGKKVQAAFRKSKVWHDDQFGRHHQGFRTVNAEYKVIH